MTGSPDGRLLDAVPAGMADIFGNRLPMARAFHDRLAGPGLERGLLGPREVPRLWERHLGNCAVLTDCLPEHARVVDVGSGAGLPGLVLAIRRPDLRVDLVEPMLRRTEFLAETVETLDLGGRVRIVRGRAEDRSVRDLVAPSDWVCARAVAPLDRLVEWCLPLLTPGGRLLALKGTRARQEVEEYHDAVRRAGGAVIGVHQLGEQMLTEPTWVIEVERRPSASLGGRRRGRR